MGRARDVVRVGLRSTPSESLSAAISSSIPLADFYANLFTVGECPYIIL